VIHVSRSGSGNGIGWSRRGVTTAKTVAVAPTPSARISTTTAASAGFRLQLRIACVRSVQMLIAVVSARRLIKERAAPAQLKAAFRSARVSLNRLLVGHFCPQLDGED
jgi:hypothetical protein